MPMPVASYMGAWIETKIPIVGIALAAGRILHGCVD